MAKQLIVLCFLPFLLAGVCGDILGDGQASILTQAVPLKTGVLAQIGSTSNVLGVVSNLASAPTALLSGVSSQLTGLITPHLNMFNQVFDTLISTLSPAISCVLDLPGQLIDAVTSVANSVVKCVTPIATAASNLLSQVLDVKVVAEAVNLVKSVTDILGCVLGSLLNPAGLLTCVQNLVNSALNLLTGLLQQVLGLLTGALSTVLSVATCLLSGATNVLNTATDLTLGLVGCAAGAGANVTVPGLPSTPTDHSKTINEAFGKINATAPTQKEFDRVCAVFNATVGNVTQAFPTYTNDYITASVTKGSKSYSVYLSTYGKSYLAKGDTVTAACATNGSTSIDAYCSKISADVATKIGSTSARTATLQQTIIVLEQGKYDLVVNKGYTEVTKCGTSFTDDSQVPKCCDNAVNNFKASLNDKLDQATACNNELNTIQYQPQDLISNGLLACGKYATDAYKYAKACSGNKL